MFRREKKRPDGVTEKEVLQALSTIIDPDLHQDIVSLDSSSI